MAKTQTVSIAIVHESDIGDYLHTFNVKAFPTYILFHKGTEAQRVEGVNLQGVKDMIAAHADKAAGPAIPEKGGNTLGGSHSVAEARALRLAKLEAKSPLYSQTKPLLLSTQLGFTQSIAHTHAFTRMHQDP